MWYIVIPEVCKELEQAGIKYHADSSSSLYVNGFKLDMDDFDVTIEWSCIEKARVIY